MRFIFVIIGILSFSVWTWASESEAVIGSLLHCVAQKVTTRCLAKVPKKSVGPLRMGESYKILFQGKEIFQGDITKMRRDPSSYMITLSGAWMYKGDDARTFTRRRNEPVIIQKYERPGSLLSFAGDENQGNDFSARPHLPFAPLDELDLRNEWGGALFNILGKMGSPFSPSSSYGLQLEYNPFEHLPFILSGGSYESPRTFKSDREISISTMNAGASLMVGAKESYLQFGIQIGFVNLKGDQPASSLVLTPSSGVRLQSDAELIFDLNYHFPIFLGKNLRQNAGSLATDIGLFSGKSGEISLGLGMGI